MLSYKKIYACLAGEYDPWLFSEAQKVRLQNFGPELHLRGVIEFSSYCGCNCHYCGLRRDNVHQRYRLSHEEILETALSGIDMGFQTLVLQSGEDPFYSAEMIADLVAAISRESSVAITLSLGEQSYENLALWKKAGAHRYLLKLETTDTDLYHQYRPDASFVNRLEMLCTLQKLGYETGSGVIVGLPAGNRDPYDVLAQDIIFLTKLNLDMIAAGPLIPHPKTPFAGAEFGRLDLSHRVLALLRLCNPQANIPATSAMDALARMRSGGDNPHERVKALGHGCNVLMESIPLAIETGNYDIYPTKQRQLSPFSHGMKIIRAAQKI
ncbi:MAG: [FeFe] hydrogenase H-cluster radical SAM maturase HydE [Desulfotalea sp.]